MYYASIDGVAQGRVKSFLGSHAITDIFIYLNTDDVYLPSKLNISSYWGQSHFSKSTLLKALLILWLLIVSHTYFLQGTSGFRFPFLIVPFTHL
jgi:hypothetical protein